MSIYREYFCAEILAKQAYNINHIQSQEKLTYLKKKNHLSEPLYHYEQFVKSRKYIPLQGYAT